MSHQQRNDKATSKQCLGNGNNNNPAKQRRKKKQRGEPLGLEMVAHPELLAAVTDATTTSTTPIATSTKDCSSQACSNLPRQVSSSSSSTDACNNKTLDDVVMTEVNEHINIVDEDCAEDLDSGDKEVSTYDIDDIEGGDEAYHYSYEYDDESYQSYDLSWYGGGNGEEDDTTAGGTSLTTVKGLCGTQYVDECHIIQCALW